MAGEVEVHMRWPAEVHARAKALAVTRGTSVTGLCLGLLMAELERVAAARATSTPETRGR